MSNIQDSQENEPGGALFMSSYRGVQSLLFSLFLLPAFGETAPWQKGIVVSVEQRSFEPSLVPDYRCSPSNNGTNSTYCQPVKKGSIQYWDVTINLANQVITVRPYYKASGVSGAVIAVLSGMTGQDPKQYVLPQDVAPGMAVKVAIFSNGTVTLQNGKGQNYSGEIASQALISNPAPVGAETVSPRQLPTVDEKADFPWRQVDDPNQRWKFTIGDQFVFGELAMPPDRQRIGDFLAFDAKKQGDKFVGTVRLRATILGDGGSTKTCEYTFAVELASVTPDRIEGKMGDEVDQKGCTALGNGDWGMAIWIRE